MSISPPILQNSKELRKANAVGVQTKAEDRNLKALRYSLQLCYNEENANY